MTIIPDDAWRKSSRSSGLSQHSNCVECVAITATGAPAPVTYTDPSVYEAIAAGADWADTRMDPTQISPQEWAARQADALIWFEVRDGRPVNPHGPTGIRHGRGWLGQWGEQPCGDAAVTATCGGHRWIVMIERTDNDPDGDPGGDNIWALPGGHVDRGEDPRTTVAAIRELAEEASLALPGARWDVAEPRPVDDPRASDEAWMVTVLCSTDLGTVDQLPPVKGRSDAARAAWVRAGSYDELTGHLTDAYGGHVFGAHVEMLREHLA